MATPSGAGLPCQRTEPGTSVAPEGTVAVKESRTAPAEPETETW
ncbi:hypothetical protein AB0J80_25115 [Actinoplanes sp. NPDC049548]